jgi:hypothetical protein
VRDSGDFIARHHTRVSRVRRGAAPGHRKAHAKGPGGQPHSAQASDS